MSAAASGTKKKMDQFLDSFDDKVTIWTKPGDETHKSTEHRPGVESEKQFFSRHSNTPIDSLSAQARQDIETYLRDGYVILENVLNAEELAWIQKDSRGILDKVSFGDNDFYGRLTRRAYSLLAKTRSFDSLFAKARVNEPVSALYAPNALLSAFQLVEISPGEKEQKMHTDNQFSNHGDITRGDVDVANMILAIDDFTAENGATVIIPGSHRWPRDRLPAPNDKRVQAIMRAGSICMFHGNLWHAGGANKSQRARRGVIVVFTQPWLRPLENQFLAVPFDVAAKLQPQLQSYLGYSLNHPFGGQVDFQHPRKKLLELAAELEKLKAKL